MFSLVSVVSWISEIFRANRQENEGNECETVHSATLTGLCKVLLENMQTMLLVNGVMFYEFNLCRIVLLVFIRK